MKFADLSGSAKGAAVLAILSLVISVHLSSTSSVNGALTSCTYFDIAKVVLGGLAIVVGIGGVLSARRDISAARNMNMAVPGIAAAVGAFSVLVGFGLILGPC